MPIPSISHSTTSPGASERCGSMNSPQPHGVPVSSTSPGSSVNAARAEADQLGDAEDHQVGGRVLHHLAVDAADQAQRLRVGDLVGGHDHRADRAERVQALAAHPLAVGELQVARGDVVGDRVAEHVVERVLDGDVARARARSRRPARPPSRRARSAAPGCGSASSSPITLDGNFANTSGSLGRLQAALADVVEVVEADRDDLAGHDRREPRRARRPRRRRAPARRPRAPRAGRPRAGAARRRARTAATGAPPSTWIRATRNPRSSRSRRAGAADWSDHLATGTLAQDAAGRQAISGSRSGRPGGPGPGPRPCSASSRAGSRRGR